MCCMYVCCHFDFLRYNMRQQRTFEITTLGICFHSFKAIPASEVTLILFFLIMGVLGGNLKKYKSI